MSGLLLYVYSFAWLASVPLPILAVAAILSLIVVSTVVAGVVARMIHLGKPRQPPDVHPTPEELAESEARARAAFDRYVHTDWESR